MSTPKTKKHLKLIVRLAISVIFLLVIYRNVEFSSLFQTLKSISLTTALLLPLLYTFGQIMSVVKWNVLIEHVSLRRPYGDIFRSYFVGMFVNNIAFGTVGGDVARCVALEPQRGERARTFATVIADRVQGLTVLAAIGTVSILWFNPPALPQEAGIFLAFVTSALIFGWFFGPRILLRLAPNKSRLRTIAIALGEAFPQRDSALLRITLISFFFHSLQICMHGLIAHELHLSLPLPYLFALVPLVNIASTLPVSINGLGVREAGYVLLFVPLGISKEAAVAFGAIWIVTVMLVSAIGGLLLGSTLKLRSLEERAEEVEEFTDPPEQKRAVA